MLVRTDNRRTHGGLLLEEDKLGQGRGFLQQLTSAELRKQMSWGGLLVCLCAFGWVSACVGMCEPVGI